jgi:uncharacterized alpha-E superfamily protein
MVIKPTWGAKRSEPVFVEQLAPAERRALGEAILARPEDYVGQEQMELSTAPVLEPEGLTPRHLSVRVFLVATGAAADGDYSVMPGGLTRIAATADTLVVSMQKGGGSKDTWVLSDSPVSTFSLLPATVQPVALSRDGDDLPSRAADNLYWLGRYVDRVDSLVRLLRGILVRSTEQSGLTDAAEVPTLLRALTNSTRLYPGIYSGKAEERLTALERELSSIIGDSERSGSLAASVHAVHRIARKVRDRLSLDMWRILSILVELYEGEPTGLDGDKTSATRVGSRAVPDHDALRRLSVLREVLDQTVVNLSAFGGLVGDSMTRGQGWRFLDMGRRLERALQISVMIRSTLVSSSGPEVPLLEAILEIADSAMTYRRRYMSHVETAPVLDLLLADETNPRSLAYQLAKLAESVDHLPRSEFAPGRSEAQRIILGALTRLRIAEVGRLARTDQSGYRPELEDLLSRIDNELPILSDALSRHYFTHLQPPRQFARSTDPR